MLNLKEKIQTALNEARILVLGAQVLLGLEYESLFEPQFVTLPLHSQYLKFTSLLLLLVAFSLLIAPVSYHRLVNQGDDSASLPRFIRTIMIFALLPFALALGIDLFIAVDRILDHNRWFARAWPGARPTRFDQSWRTGAGATM
jgi:hypothetical protein